MHILLEWICISTISFIVFHLLLVFSSFSGKFSGCSKRLIWFFTKSYLLFTAFLVDFNFAFLFWFYSISFLHPYLLIFYLLILVYVVLIFFQLVFLTVFSRKYLFCLTFAFYSKVLVSIPPFHLSCWILCVPHWLLFFSIFSLGFLITFDKDISFFFKSIFSVFKEPNLILLKLSFCIHLLF